MSRYDDDYDDENEDGRDEDEVDDEDGVRGSTSNPFSSKPNSVRGAGIPQQPQRPPTPSGGGSVPSPIRSPGANPNQGQGGNSQFPNRPGGNNQSGGSGSSGGSPQPYQRQSPITRSPCGDDKKD